MRVSFGRKKSLDKRAASVCNIVKTGGKFMDSSDMEICSNCGLAINRAEQAHVFEGNIVCAECDLQLRSGPLAEPVTAPELAAAPESVTAAEPQPEAGRPPKTDEQEEEKQRVVAGKSVGFIIAGVILCLLGVGLIVIGLVGLAVFFWGGSTIGVLVVGGCVISGMLILILGIAAIVVAVISRQPSVR